MDKSELGKDAREEVTRESLIAISYSVPDKAPVAKPPPDKINGDDSDADGADKYRSELISISYSDSPDTKLVLPVNRPDT